MPDIMATRQKAPKRIRSKMLTVPATPKEKKLFFGMAKWRHQTFAEFVRQILYREAKVSKVA